MEMAAIPAAHSCKLGPRALTHPETGTGCAPPPPPPRVPTLSSFAPNLEKQNLPPLFGRQIKKARLKETSHSQGFLCTSPCWSLRKPPSVQSDGENLLSLLETEAGFGQCRTRRSSAKGRSPHPLCDASRGATPPVTHLPHPGQSLPAPQPAPLRERRAGVGESVPHPRMPGLPGGPGVTAPHLERPRPHLPHFLVLSHP